MMNIKEQLKNIKEVSGLELKKTSLDVDSAVWKKYAETAKKTNLSMKYVNTVMVQYFTEELERIMEER